MDDRVDLPQGTLDLLILKTLAVGAKHGWAISERLHQISSATLHIRQGSLYPALHRLEQQGWVRSEWGVTEKNREARFYSLTPAGRKQLTLEEESWARLTDGVRRVLRYV